MDLVNRLTSESKRILIAHLARRKYSTGQTLFQKGEPCTYLSQIIDGCIDLVISAATGREVIVSKLFSGETLGLLQIGADGSYLTDVVAGSSLEIATIPRNLVLPLMERDMSACQLLDAFAERNRRNIWVLETLSMCNLEVRLARMLHYLASEYGTRGPRGTTIPFRLPQAQLAMMVNASRPKVNMRLRKWVADRVLDISRNVITITDINHLAVLADS